MKFDIILGNPPYNDIQGASDKKGGSKHMKTNIYPLFIILERKLLKPNGTMSYILPHGAFNYFYKNGLYISKVIFNKTKVWGKQIPTRTYIVTKNHQPTAKIVNPIFAKIAKWDALRVRNRKLKPGYKLYNYIRPLKIYTIPEIEAMDVKQANKNNAPIFIPHTDINLKNINTLLTFFSRYLDQYAAMWGSYSKILCYDWLDGLKYEITKETIIKRYNLTPEEVKEIENAV